MKIGHDHVGVRVPATSANLGPGFDSLGLALSLVDDIEVWATTGATSVTVTGEGAGELPGGDDHLVVRAVREALDLVGAPQMGLKMRCHNRIPHGQGLGSSAAAVVGGILVARALIAEPDALDDAVALSIASQLEGHPDNAAPALLGGATVAYRSGPGVAAVSIPVHGDVLPTVLVPTERLATTAARAALPQQVPFADAVSNLSRAALLVEALSRRPELLFPATEDVLHQPYRREVYPQSYEVMAQLRSQGHAAAISGAGPSVLVLTAGERPTTSPEGWTVIHPTIRAVGAQIWQL